MNFQPESLRERLSPFPSSVPEAADFQGYRHFYKIDFEQKIGSIESDIGIIFVDGFDIVVHSFTPHHAVGTVFIVHGYYDHVGEYKHLIQFFLKQQYAVVVFDLPGHGLSSGDRVSISSFEQYQHVWRKVIDVSENMPKPWHVVAQSTGAAIVSEYLLTETHNKNTIPFFGVTYYAPLVRPVNWLWKSHLHMMVHPFCNNLERKFTDSSNDKDFLSFRLQDPLQSRSLSLNWVHALKRWIPHFEQMKPIEFPMLIIQGRADKTVDWQHNIPVLQRLFKAVNVVYMDDVKHHVANEAARYRKNVFDQTLRYFKAVV